LITAVLVRNCLITAGGAGRGLERMGGWGQRRRMKLTSASTAKTTSTMMMMLRTGTSVEG